MECFLSNSNRNYEWRQISKHFDLEVKQEWIHTHTSCINMHITIESPSLTLLQKSAFGRNVASLYRVFQHNFTIFPQDYLWKRPTRFDSSGWGICKNVWFYQLSYYSIPWAYEWRTPFLELAAEKSNIFIRFLVKFGMENVRNFILISILKVVFDFHRSKVIYARKTVCEMLR